VFVAASVAVEEIGRVKGGNSGGVGGERYREAGVGCGTV
jgi:hypothetical protein